MGKWSPYVYDNDTALGFMWNVVYESFKMAKVNDEYLVVADMFIKYGAVDCVGEIIEKLTEVINEELSSDVINKWKEEDRDARMRMLSNILTHVKTIKKENNIK